MTDALAAAQPGDAIHVAQGIYRPDRSAASPDGSGDRTATFLLRNDVDLRGGYAGLGAADPSANDPASYPSTLSGDLAGDDRAYPGPTSLIRTSQAFGSLSWPSIP